MTPRLLVAPAASGKTQHAIDRLRAIKASDPFAPVTVILPNQIQLAEFRRRLAQSGGAIGVELLTFHLLYAELLTRVDQRRARLTDPLQVRLLRQIVDQLCDANRLPYFAALRDKPGFIAVLRDTLEELKRARIFPNIFLSAVLGLGPRLEELATIYAAYQDWLQRNDWADAEGQGWLAAIALEDHKALGSDLRLLIVNGFDEFNPTQLGVLTILAQRAQETLITLTGDLDRPRLAQRRFDRARQAIIKQLHIAPEVLKAEFGRRNATLSAIEEHLFENPKSKILNPKSIEFLEAQNRSEESRAALRWIKQRLVHDGLQLNEVAILARSLEAYRPFLIEVSAEFGLPLHLVGGTPLIDNPAIAALMSLLSLPVLNWPRRQMIEAWRSPYFAWSAQGITASDTATLDHVSRFGRVMGGIDQWREAFQLLTQTQLTAATDDEDQAVSDLAPVDAALLHRKFAVFVDALTPPTQATLRDYVAFIEDLIGDPEADDTGVGLAAQLRQNPHTFDRDFAALQVFKDALRGLVLSETTLGDAQPIDYRTFVGELRGAVEAMSYAPDDSGAGLFTASVLDARGLSFRVVALLGLAEGEFPQAEREGVLLRETDRAVLRDRGLSIEPQLRGDEVTFFYQAVTRATDRLLLSRPYLAPDGQPWEPSPYWVQVTQLIDQPTVRKVRPEDSLDPAEAASPIELVQATRHFDQHVQHRIEVLRARLSPLASVEGGLYEGTLPQLASLLQQRYSPTHGWSASRLEMYGTCPFAFYIAHALQLEPRTPPEEGYDARVLGSMLHKILEEVYQHDDPLSALPAEAHRVFATAPIDYGFRPSALWDAQQHELEEALRETITALAEASEGFTPRYFEQKFGMGNPSLIVRSDDGAEIRLHGYIDRVDADQHGQLRVIDYKASGAAISAKDLDKGKRLQLPLYALAAQEALHLGEVTSGFYWHILQGTASSFKLEKYPDGLDAAFDRVKQHVIDHVRNIRAGQFQPVPPDDGCPSYCPAVAFCWRYKAKSW
jgi:ATP-dependent helicase/nuclease subunit B